MELHKQELVGYRTDFKLDSGVAIREYENILLGVIKFYTYKFPWGDKYSFKKIKRKGVEIKYHKVQNYSIFINSIDFLKKYQCDKWRISHPYDQKKIESVFGKKLLTPEESVKELIELRKMLNENEKTYYE